jgi:cytosine/adenosine deaminase-related metal-dependent hydrolase
MFSIYFQIRGLIIMRTMIKGSYIVAFDGNEHRMLQNGVLVYEDDKIIHVGKSFKGKIDKTIDAKGKLVCPGFINIHALTSICITHFRTDYIMGRRGGHSKEEMLEGLRNPRAYLEGEDLKTSSQFCFAELLKGGATTIGEITAFGSSGLQPPREQAETFVETAGEMGARAYISHPYINGKTYADEDGSRVYYFDEEGGQKALENAVGFCEEYEGVHDDRVRTMLFPYMFDACSEGLLRETRARADELNVPIHMHTSQYLSEYYESLRRYGKTPIHFLHDIGFLGPKTILTHVLYTPFNPLTPEGTRGDTGRDTRDIELMAKTGTTLGHTPVIWSRLGVLLHSYGQCKKSGVNIAIGTDAFPMDMIMEMRHAAILGKIADQNRMAVTAKDVFNAATLGGAKALGRKDLGHLAPGAKADVVIVDLTGLHVALIDDPIKTLVYMGSQRDVEAVIVDGRVVVDGGRVPGVDEEELARKANELNQNWKNGHGTIAPPSFKEIN